MKWGPYSEKDVKQGFYHLEKALGNINAVRVLVDFGAGSTVTTSRVDGLKWVRGDTVFSVSITGALPDHQPAEAILEELAAGIGEIFPGSGFEVIAKSPEVSWGKYWVHVVGVNDQ